MRTDSVLLLLSLKGKFSLFFPDPTLFPLVPDCDDLLFFFPEEIGADGVLVLFSSCFLSNSGGSANRESSKFFHF